MNGEPHAALLVFVASPDHVLLLLLCGILFIYAEFNKPGTVLLGCIGALLLMFGLYGLGRLPLSPLGIVSTLAGVVLVGLGCKYPVRGVVTVAGTLCLIFGLANLVVARRIHLAVAIAVAIIFSFVTTWLVRIALLARQNKSLLGPHAMIGRIATVRTALAPTGQVEVRGELWQATLGAGGYLSAGAKVVVRGVHELELLVEASSAEGSSAE
jgi:membrane-bound serine protease (ClpP class)